MANQLTPDPETLLPFQPRVTTQIPEAQIAAASPPPQFSVATPNVTNASELLELQTLREQLRNIPKLQEELISAITPTTEEKALAEQLEAARIKESQIAAGEAAGVAKIRAQAIPQPLIGRQAEVLREQTALLQQQLATQVLPLELKLQRLQKERETVVGAAKVKLGFAEKQFDIAIQLQRLTRPDVLKTEVLDTGEVVSIVQDPLRGTIQSQIVGKVAPKEKDKYQRFGEYVSSDNKQVVYGVTKEGKVDILHTAPAKVSPVDIRASAEEKNLLILHEPDMVAAIRLGAATPEQVLGGVIAVAAQRGIKLDINQQTAILSRARELLAQGVAPTPTPPRRTARERGEEAGRTAEFFIPALKETVVAPFKATGEFFRGLFGR